MINPFIKFINKNSDLCNRGNMPRNMKIAIVGADSRDWKKIPSGEEKTKTLIDVILYSANWEFCMFLRLNLSSAETNGAYKV